jgi:hypothetical protein
MIVTAHALPAAGNPIDCLSSYGSQFSGHLTTDTGSQRTWEGTTAHIENNNGAICDTGLQNSNNFWYDWVMLANNIAGGSNRAHVQVGYFRYWGSCIYWATEYQKLDNGNFTRHIKTADGCRTGSAGDFTVAYNPSTGYEQMKAGSTGLDTTPWDVYSVWTLPFVPEVSGETKYIGTDIPGTSSNPTTISHINLQKYSDDSWTTDSGTLPSWSGICRWPVRYARTAISSHAYSFYTKSSSSTDENC